MNAYLETSAVLSWVLEEPDGAAVEKSMKGARRLVTSELTLAECRRALQRLGAPPASTAILRLQALQLRWHQVPVHSYLLDRVGQAFPVEPVRTLDAVHLVTALDLRSVVVGLQLVSLDHRVRDNAVALGFTVLP